MANCINTKELTKELRKRISDEKPLDGEDFFTEEETLVRFLKAREWNLDAAEKQLRDAVTWRRTFKPLTIDCSWCHDQPGYHSMRQVGFDELGRPVIYSCFAQADSNRNSVEDSVAHCTYLIENAKKTMRPGVTTWIFVIDCTGMSLPACNPRLGYAVTQIMSTYYPERLGKVLCVNHSALFHGVWNAIKVFLHPATSSKMIMLRGKNKIRNQFDAIFPPELSEWLMEEMRRNKKKKYSPTQKLFWKKPEKQGEHDPRGCPDYTRNFLDSVNTSNYKAHPNIIDVMTGKMVSSKQKHNWSQSDAKLLNSVSSGSLTVSEDSDDADECSPAPSAASIFIPEEFAIPKDAMKMQ